MKKITLFLLSILTLVLLCACSGMNISKDSYNEKEIHKTIIEKMQENGEFDEILCSGEDLFLVKKTEDNYNGFRILVGVVNQNGDWIHNLSSTNIFAKAILKESEKSDILSGNKAQLGTGNFEYLGEGIFIASLGVTMHFPGYSRQIGIYSSTGSTGLECYFFNVKENIQISFPATDITPYHDGYMLMYQSNRYNSNFYNVNTKGEITKLPCIYDSWVGLSFPAYSDGVFFAENKFFDILGNVVLDISEYDLYGSEYGEDSTPPYFVNGKCTIKFRNNGGTLYKAVIDKQGNFVEKPSKLIDDNKNQ
ncbi:MAG: hypothetical protein J6B55_07505 [Clostridia bacterium]|nr:hypothetical protein [Clostridia bacterium]